MSSAFATASAVVIITIATDPVTVVAVFAVPRYLTLAAAIHESVRSACYDGDGDAVL